MIDAKYKKLFLLPVVDGWVSQPFNMKGHKGYDPKKNTHNGIDLGYYKNQYSDILACQDGVVKAVFYNSSVGNAIALQHDYSDGTHSFTAYIHLKELPKLKVGQTVKQGDKLGIKGGSPYVNGKQKFGTHLHLYLTSATTKAYSWNTMKSLVVDPFPYLYRSKKIEYNKLNSSLTVLPILEDSMIQVVKPVERDVNKDQLSESTDKLRVRMEPSLKGTIIGYLQKDKYYDWYDMKTNDNYEWYQIEANQWVAKTSTMTIYPKVDGEALLKEEIKQLTEFVDKLTLEVSSLQDKIRTAISVLNED